MDMETVLRRLTEAHSMIADILNGWPTSELCRDPEEWLADTRRTLEAAGVDLDA